MIEGTPRLRALARRSATAAGALGVVTLLGALVNPYWKPTWDSAVYLSLAQSIVDGSPYLYMGHPHSLYPPGLPLVLAALLASFGPSYLGMRLLMVGFALAGAAAAYLVLRDRVGRPRAGLLAAAFVTSFPIIDTATFVLSDIPFAFFSLTALLFVGSGAAPPRGWRLAAAAASLLAAIAFRTIGGVLLAAILGHGLARSLRARSTRDARAWALLGAVVLIPTAAWLYYLGARAGRTSPPEGLAASASNATLFTRANPGNSGSRDATPGDYARRVQRNLEYYSVKLSSNLLGSRGLAFRLSVWTWAALLFPLAGYVLVCRSRPGPVEVFAPLYMMILLAWPYAYLRFQIPILPFFFEYALVGLEWLFERLRGLRSREARPSAGAASPLPAAACALVGLSMLGNAAAGVSLVRKEQARPYLQGGNRGIVAACEWLARSSSPEDLVVVFQAPIVHWLTGRRALVPPWSAPPEEQLRMVDRSGAAWVVMNPPLEGGGGYLRRMLAAHPERFEEAATVEGVRIYRVMPAPAAGGPRGAAGGA